MTSAVALFMRAWIEMSLPSNLQMKGKSRSPRENDGRISILTIPVYRMLLTLSDVGYKFNYTLM